MPVDGVLPTVPVEAGSKHENVTFYDVLYRFYEAVRGENLSKKGKRFTSYCVQKFLNVVKN